MTDQDESKRLGEKLKTDHNLLLFHIRAFMGVICNIQICRKKNIQRMLKWKISVFCCKDIYCKNGDQTSTTLLYIDEVEGFTNFTKLEVQL